MKIKAILGLILILTSASQAAVVITLTENPSTGPVFKTSALSPVADGRLVRLGTFDVQPPANSTFAQLAATFHEFSTTQIGHSGAPNTGRMNKLNIAGTIGTTGPGGVDDPDSFFVGKKIYIWVYDSNSLNTAVGQGVFGSATSTDTFKDQGTTFSMSITRFTLAFGTFADGVPANTASSTAGAPAANGPSLILAGPVPEPGTSVFLLLGVLGMAFRRRK